MTARFGMCGAALLSSWVAAAAPLPCEPAGDEICRTMATPEFVSAYNRFFDSSFEPGDAIDDIRFNLREIASGAGKASPAAIGPQLDAALEDALFHIKRGTCGAGNPRSPGAATVAGAFARGARLLGITLSPSELGGLTATFVGALSSRRAGCVCDARNVDALRGTCASSGSR